MWKVYGGLIASYLLATYLCGWGQVLAYGLHDYFTSIPLPHLLTALAVTAYLLYLVSGVLVVYLIEKQDFAKKHKDLYITLFLMITLPPSAWALFVTAMWWG